MCRDVEQSYEDKPVVVFSQGASGDQNPLYLRPSTNGMASRSGASITGNDLIRESVEAPLRDGAVHAKPMDPVVRDRLERWMESEGEILDEEVIRVMTNSTRTETNVRIWGSQTEVSCPGRKRIDQGREGMTASYVEAIRSPCAWACWASAMSHLRSIDAEVCNLIAQRLKRQSPLAITVMVTLANGVAPWGYVPDDASFSHNTFQVLKSRLKPGCATTAQRSRTALTVAYRTSKAGHHHSSQNRRRSR